MQMHKKLHLLLVESSQSDAQHILDNLAKSGYAVEHRHANSPEDMKPILSEYLPDIILCDHDLPQSGGTRALKLMHSLGLDLPFLFLSHDAHETTGLQPMHASVDDIIPKADLSRLAPTIEHILRASHFRQAHRTTQAALQENQARLSAFISSLPGMASQILLRTDGSIGFPYVSEGSTSLLELSPEELEQDASLFLNMLHKDDRASYNRTMQHSAEQSACWNWEGRIVMPSTGQVKWINLRCSPPQHASGSTQWEGVMLNITQSKMAEIELNRSQEELRALSLHVQDVREQERLNIAREVHDHLGGMLTAIKLEIVRMNNRLAEEKSTATDTSKGIEELLDKCIVAASNISRTLRPGVLDCFGIVAAIEMELDEFQKRTGIQCELTDIDDGDELDPELDIALFRIFQETLTNIIKHAQATQIKVCIRNQTHGISLSVSDNGQGFTDSDKNKPHSFGLRGMRERIAHLGGKLDITSAPGAGTTIAVSIPRLPASREQEQFSPQQPLLRSAESDQ